MKINPRTLRELMDEHDRNVAEAATEELRNPTHAGRRSHMLRDDKRGPDNGSDEWMYGYDDFA